MAHIIRRKHKQNQISEDSIGNLKKHKPLSTYTTIPGVSKASLWRVIAPFIRVSKKISKPKLSEDTNFSFYLQKRPAVLLRDLTSFMSDSVDLASLFHETAEVLKNVTKADGVNLYLVDRVNKELYHSRPGIIPNERYKVKWKIEVGSTVAAYVACKNEYIMVDDILGDDRFPEGIGYEGSDIPKSVLCVPVVTPEDECFAVIELFRRVNHPSFDADNLRISVMATAWMGIAIQQNQERLALRRHQELNDYLLELIKTYMGEKILKEKLMSEVIKFAKQALGAERGSFFIVDQENNEMTAHLYDENDNPQYKKGLKLNFRGIAGLVAMTGSTMNIQDAYKDSRFNEEVDLTTGYITRSILCMPIMGAQGALGVVQLINKSNGGAFTTNDESLFNTFSLYCALALHYTNIHTKVTKMVKQSNIDTKIIHLQLQPCIHDYKKFIHEPRASIPRDFNEYFLIQERGLSLILNFKFSWYFNNSDEYARAPQLCLYMFLDMIDITEIDLKSLMKFILTARKLYRDIPYHNFEHAFNVCHCMYLLLKLNRDKFSKLEIKALLVATLCHDVDHPGITNNFLNLIKDDLAQLYQKSILENHHYQVTMMLLQDYDLYPSLSRVQRNILKTEIENTILASDLALYFEKKAQMIKMYNEKSFDWVNESHRNALKAIMMTACDLSGQCKPFIHARRITENLYREFYRQGDLEKDMGLTPLSIMDRAKEYCIPEDQIQFLNVVVIPCVEILRILLPNTKQLHIGALRLRQTWMEIKEARGTKVWRQDDSFVIVHKFPLKGPVHT